MTLKIIQSKIINCQDKGNADEGNKSIWEDEGINEQDHELARELGIENPIIDDFDTMVNDQEDINDEFFDDLKSFKEEEDRTYNDFGYVNCEVIDREKTQEGVEVRVIKKWYDGHNAKWALGSIDGAKEVYIPRSLAKRVTVGEIVRMDLIFSPQNSNNWKAIFIHTKIDPVVVEELMEENLNVGALREQVKMMTLHIPKQDIGKMIGKKGFNLRKAMKDYFYRNPTMKNKFNTEPYVDTDEWWNSSIVPSLDIHNMPNKDYTEVKMWCNKNLMDDSIHYDFDPIKDFVKKLYC